MEHDTCKHCTQAIHKAFPFGWLHDNTGRRRCDLPVYVDAEPQGEKLPEPSWTGAA